MASVRIRAASKAAGPFHFDVPGEHCLDFARSMHEKLAPSEPLTMMQLVGASESESWSWDPRVHWTARADKEKTWA